MINSIRYQAVKQRYNDYINSPAWEGKKYEIGRVYLGHGWPIACMKCGASGRGLQLHHNHYMADLDDANYSDLDYLCKRCHDEWHQTQIDSGSSQNRLLSEYYEFLFRGKSPSERHVWCEFLKERLDLDEAVLENYFTQPEVKEYEKQSAISAWIFFLSLPLFLVPFIIWELIGKGSKTPLQWHVYKSKRDEYLNKKAALQLWRDDSRGYQSSIQASETRTVRAPAKKYEPPVVLAGRSTPVAETDKPIKELRDKVMEPSPLTKPGNFLRDHGGATEHDGALEINPNDVAALNKVIETCDKALAVKPANKNVLKSRRRAIDKLWKARRRYYSGRCAKDLKTIKAAQ